MFFFFAGMRILTWRRMMHKEIEHILHQSYLACVNNAKTRNLQLIVRCQTFFLWKYTICIISFVTSSSFRIQMTFKGRPQPKMQVFWCTTPYRMVASRKTWIVNSPHILQNLRSFFDAVSLLQIKQWTCLSTAVEDLQFRLRSFEQQSLRPPFIIETFCRFSLY